MKKAFKSIIIIILSGLITVFALYIISVKEILFKTNGFDRKFITKIKLKDKFFLNQNASEIIGITEDKIYLVNEDRNNIFILYLNSGNFLNLNYKSFLKQVNLLQLHQVSLDNDNLIITSPINRKIYITSIDDTSKFKKYDLIATKQAVDVLGFSKSTYFLKGRDSTLDAALFTLNKSANSKLIYRGDTIIGNTREDIIADDGFFLNSKEYLIYAKYHKNEFFLLNKNGDVKYKKITIAKKSVSPRINKSINGTVTLMGQINYKNLRGDINNNNLYIQSGVKADNENAFRFKFNSIIDVYSLTKYRSYLNSFYIPSYAGVKTNSFKIINNKLFALHGNYLIIYNIHNE